MGVYEELSNLKAITKLDDKEIIKLNGELAIYKYGFFIATVIIIIQTGLLILAYWGDV